MEVTLAGLRRCRLRLEVRRVDRFMAGLVEIGGTDDFLIMLDDNDRTARVDETLELIDRFGRRAWSSRVAIMQRAPSAA